MNKLKMEQLSTFDTTIINDLEIIIYFEKKEIFYNI